MNKDYRPASLLCVCAHPDDAEVMAGGTIAKWSAAGTTVHMLVCTDGSKGSADAKKLGAEISQTRARELEVAAEMLGVESVEQHSFVDGDVTTDDELRSAIVKKIRQHKPEAVFTIDPTFLYSTQWDYPNHRDHRAVGMAVFDAVYPMARDVASFPEQIDDGLEPHKVNVLLMGHYEKENFHVDISDFMEQKLGAIRAHESQFGEAEEIVELVTEHAKSDAKAIGKKYAEAFVKLQLPA